MREAKQSGGRIWKTLAVIIMMLMVLPMSATAAETGSTALTAYRASVVPTIDGKISPGEWGDAESYLYQWPTGGEGAPITDGVLSLNVSLKHDESNLYILFTINDNETDEGDSLDIFTVIPPEIEGVGVLVLYPNNTGFEGYLTKSGVWAPPRSPEIDGVVSSTYVNGVYTFEVRLNLTHYFSLYENNSAPFNIGYTDGNPEAGTLTMQEQTVSVGVWGSTEPGIILSEHVYKESSETHPPAWPHSTLMLAMTITVLVSAGILVAIFRRIRREG